MRNNNLATLEACYNQAKEVLSNFDDYFKTTGYFLVALSLGKLEFKNKLGETIEFLFSNDYYFGTGAMPLQEIVIFRKNEDTISLSRLIKAKYPNASLRNLIAEKRKEGVSRMQAFRLVFDEYVPLAWYT